MAHAGTALDATRDVASLRPTWWRQPLVRLAQTFFCRHTDDN
jgi:hypothetical protein